MRIRLSYYINYLTWHCLFFYIIQWNKIGISPKADTSVSIENVMFLEIIPFTLPHQYQVINYSIKMEMLTFFSSALCQYIYIQMRI